MIYIIGHLWKGSENMKKDNLFIATAAILYGTITVGGQFFAYLGMSLYEITLFPISMMSVLTSVVVVFRGKLMLNRNTLRFFVLYGLVGAVLQVTQFGGLVLGLPVAVVAFLLYTQPIWTTLLGKAILKEAISDRRIVALVIAMAGVVALLKPWDVGNTANPAGICVALTAGLFLSLWVVLGRKSSVSNLDFMTITFGYTVFSTMWLWLLLPLSSFFVPNELGRVSFGLSPLVWTYITLFALIWGIFAHPLFYLGVRRTLASTAGIILLFEPISASLLAALFFGQKMTENILLGSALMILSNCLLLINSGNETQPSSARRQQQCLLVGYRT